MALNALAGKNTVILEKIATVHVYIESVTSSFLFLCMAREWWVNCIGDRFSCFRVDMTVTYGWTPSFLGG